jgi:uncharacterized membrane protein YphA (DoxX/SURF4 family)
VLLVVLRVALGFHFLYEGVWKITNPEFSAEGFLTQAKGPLAPLFYAMIPDIDGRQRLRVEKDEKGTKFISGQRYLDAWRNLKDKVVVRYALDDDQKKNVEKINQRYERLLGAYLADNLKAIDGYFGSLDRFEKEVAEGTNWAAYQQKRVWDRRMELRQEVNGWLKVIDRMEKAYRDALWSVLKADQRAEGPLPSSWTQKDLLNYAVMFSLSAIGLCLILGLCTRLSAIGGGVFMLMVLATQPTWPPIYPPPPEVVGHSLIVDKNFVEMLALFLIATTAAGRWAGLDFFLYTWFGRPVEAFLLRNRPHATWNMQDYADEIAELSPTDSAEEGFGLYTRQNPIRRLGAEVYQKWGSNGMRQVWNLVKQHPRYGGQGESACQALTHIWDGVGDWKR